MLLFDGRYLSSVGMNRPYTGPPPPPPPSRPSPSSSCTYTGFNDRITKPIDVIEDD